MMRAFFRLLNTIIPKKENAWAFLSIPDFSDNPRAFFEYVRKKYPESNITWIVESYEMYSRLKKLGIGVERKNRVKGLYTFFRSKVVISSHTDFSSIKACRQLFINLWHGIPLKAIGYMDNGVSYKRPPSLNHPSSVTISTSDTVNTLLGACFHVNSKQLFISGLPRNDNLFNPVPPKSLSSLLNLDISKYSKIVFYMPTFREGYLERIEGASLQERNPFRFKTFDSEVFEAYLSRNDILFICKLHPFEEKIYKNSLSSLKKNLVILTGDDLKKGNTELYRVLAKADLLITDYSSVYFDYLLLGRPIVFTPTDLEEYKRKRGFLLEPYDFWTPGPKAVTQEALQEEILKCLNDRDYYRKERETINDIINHFKDNRSCERVAEFIMGKLNKPR